MLIATVVIQTFNKSLADGSLKAILSGIRNEIKGRFLYLIMDKVP